MEALFCFIDLSQEDGYVDSDFEDEVHMSPEGTRKFTGALAREIKKTPLAN